jgi:hypothetical protein
MKQERIMLAWANVAMKFAYLEWEVQGLLGDLIDSCQGYGVGMLACDDYSFSQKLNKLKELAEFRLYRDETLTNSIIELYSKIDNLRKKRNLFIHGNWMMNDKLVTTERLFLNTGGFRRTKRGGVIEWGIDITEWKISDFNKLSKQIDDVLEQVASFKKNYGGKLWRLLNHTPKEIIDNDGEDSFGQLLREETYSLYEYEKRKQKH